MIKIIVINIMYGCFILGVIIILYVIYYLFIRREFLIKPSKIHGKGVFSKKEYKKEDVLIKNLFPFKHPDRILIHTEDVPDFHEIIILEGKYLNHCSKNYNSLLFTDDYKIFRLEAIKDIKIGEEIITNYDVVNKHIPFIANSKITEKNHYKC